MISVEELKMFLFETYQNIEPDLVFNWQKNCMSLLKILNCRFQM